ncbi:MAG TPA: YfhO family protein [Bacteroidota bacterium]|nr:YfhO family protein [Bacteroidota bacterium]
MARNILKKNEGSPSSNLPQLRDWHAIAIIIVLVGVYFRDIILQNAFFWEDFLYQFYPFRNFAAVSIAHGEMPLWNPYTFNGTPFQADIQSALFYLPNLLLTLFVTGDRLHFYWVELLTISHYAIAGICMYYLMNDLINDKRIALFSGLVYAVSGFMVTHAIHEVIICQVAWFPLVFLLFRRMLLQRSILYMIMTAAVLGLALLAGFPQLTLYFFLFLGFYFFFEIFHAIKKDGWRVSRIMVPLAIGVIVLSVMLTAIQLLPTIELVPYSQRAEITYEKSLEGSLALEQLITLVIPKYFGASTADGSTYWGPGAYWAFWETCFYVGIPALVMMLFALRHIKQNRYVIFFTGILLFSVLYALGDQFILHKFFFSTIPGFDKFRNPGRMSLLFTFSVAALSGYGLHFVFHSLQALKKAYLKIVTGIAAVGILIWIGVQGGIFQSSNNAQVSQQIYAMTSKESLTALIIILITCALLYLYITGKASAKLTFVVLLGIQFVDLYIFGFNQNNGDTSPSQYYSRTSDIVTMMKEEGKREFFRVNARQSGAILIDRNQGMIDKIFLMEGYTPLSLQRIYPPGKDWDQVCDMMNAKYRLRIDEQRRTMNLEKAITYLPRAYIVHQAMVIQEEKEMKAYMESGNFEPDRMVLLDEEALFNNNDTSAALMDSAVITSYRLNSISVEVSTMKPGFLVLSEVHYPGWNAYVDGIKQKVYRANWNQRAVLVKPGKHFVEVRFEPESFHRGTLITVLSIGLSGVGVVYSIRKKRTQVQREI